MKSFVIVDEEAEINQRYITCAEYQLFLDEEYQKGNYYHPIHWKALSFSKGQANEPVAGIRALDAMAFCNWLNNYDSLHYYRLPTSKEIQAHKIYKNLATWSITNSEINLIPNNERVNSSKLLSQDVETKLEKSIYIDVNHAIQYLNQIYKTNKSSQHEILPKLIPAMLAVLLAVLVFAVLGHIVGGILNLLIGNLDVLWGHEFEMKWIFGANIGAFIGSIAAVFGFVVFIKNCNFYKKVLLFFCLHHVYFFGKKNKGFKNNFLELIKRTENDSLKELINNIEEKNIFKVRLLATQLAIVTLKELKESNVTQNKKILSPELMQAVDRDITIINARIEGKEKALEGIRIVRERKIETHLKT